MSMVGMLLDVWLRLADRVVGAVTQPHGARRLHQWP